MLRVRLGIILIILSWVPFAQIFISIAHNHNKLLSSEASDKFRLIVWAVQIVVGLIGLWLVGKVAVQAAKGRWLEAHSCQTLASFLERLSSLKKWSKNKLTLEPNQ